MTRITIKNSFHRTQVTLNTEVDQVLTPSQVKRAEKALCGMSDCMCGGLLGGSRDDEHAIGWSNNSDGSRTYFIAR